MRGRGFTVLLCTLLACGLFMVAACGDDDGGGGGGSTASEEKGSTEGAKKIDPGLMDGAKGEVVYCIGKDTTGELKDWIGKFNAKFKSQGLSVTAREFPAAADAQRNQFIQRQQAKSGDCDVFNSDVIWTAEFASQKWLYDMTDYVNQTKDKYIEATLETATYDGKIWGAPTGTNAAFLHYNTDKVKEAPTTWQAVYQEAADKGGIVYQRAPYEGLTCDFLELAFAAGGEVLSEDGTKATIDSPENVAATKLMADGVKNGTAPKAVVTYMEPETDRAWATGKYAFMRNWPYAYALAQQSDNIKGKVEVVPLPEWEGGGKAGILGGGNAVISVYSKNPGGALQLVDYLSSEERQKQGLIKYSLPSVLTATYDDADVKKAIPFAEELRQAISQARARPVSPVYPQISQAIYKNVNEALAGRASAEDAMKQAQSDIEKALATF
jgi:multiple sugar transport system substrate-binding protein